MNLRSTVRSSARLYLVNPGFIPGRHEVGNLPSGEPLRNSCILLKEAVGTHGDKHIPTLVSSRNAVEISHAHPPSGFRAFDQMTGITGCNNREKKDVKRTGKFPTPIDRLAIMLLVILCCAPRLRGQAAEGIQIQVLDPSGALVEGAKVLLKRDGDLLLPRTSAQGTYIFGDLPTGRYDLTVESPGFAGYVEHNVMIIRGRSEQHRVRLAIAIEEQQVAVQGHSEGLSTNSNENGNATILKGNDLEALSDDPTELLNELQALAGPAAGPNGGEVYVDGFTGGQLPPRRSIREIRVNQNPFSAEFDKIGYGRIEIFTNPSSGPLHGHFLVSGNDSAWNTANPLAQQQPSYYSYFMQGSITGAITKHSSFLLSALDVKRQNQDVIDAINPAQTPVLLTGFFPNPSNFFYLNPRIDIKGKNGDTASIEDSFYHATAQGRNVGALRLGEQAFDTDYEENAFGAHDSTILNNHLVNETQLRWRRIRNTQQPQNETPTVTVQGAFITGGSNAGAVQDHQDIVELQNYATTTARDHVLRFGVRSRVYHDTNYSTAGSNSAYVFDSIAQYVANAPAQYEVTQINEPTVHTNSLMSLDSSRTNGRRVVTWTST